jgi:hypothetical protein
MECSQCETPLPPDNKTRKRMRPRKCASCLAASAKARRDDPIETLRHRWNGSCKRMYPDAENELWSRRTVEAVFERCGKKSVISGEDRAELLCLFSFFKGNIAPTPDQIVLITSREAQSLAREMTQEKRAQRFPREIQEQMAAAKE